MFGSDAANKPVKPPSRRRKMKPPGGECHDLWGASFTGSPSHLRVLKPPGGGSSDIFGSSGEPEPQRKARSHLTSSIFTEDTSTPARKPGNDSFYNLFGNESSVKPVSTVKDQSKSHIILDDTANFLVPDAKKTLNFSEDLATPAKDIGTGEVLEDNLHSDECNGSSSTNGKDCDAEEGCMYMFADAKPTNEVAEPMPDKEDSVATEVKAVVENGTKTEAPAPAPVVNGTAAAPQSAPAAAPAPTPNRQRVPPGGFSSGLW